MPPTFALGCIPSPPDDRDYHVAAFSPAEMPPLPRRVDYHPLLGPVRDQGPEGTCVGQTMAGILDELAKARGWSRFHSARDAYDQARALEPVTGEGAIPRAVLKAALKVGVALEADRPYHAGTDAPLGPEGEKHRGQNRITAYARCQTLDDLRRGLFLHGPAFLAVPVHEGFLQPSTSGGYVNRTGKLLGSHAIIACGYCEDAQAFQIRNSWGAGWGYEGDGNAWMRYSYLAGQDGALLPDVEAWQITPGLTPEGGPLAPLEAFWQAILRLFPKT